MESSCIVRPAEAASSEFTREVWLGEQGKQQRKKSPASTCMHTRVHTGVYECLHTYAYTNTQTHEQNRR